MQRTLLVVVGMILSVPFVSYAQATTFCPTGAQLVTSEQLAQLQACGATGLSVDMCFDTQTAALLSLSQCTEAKTFLKSLPKETPSQCGTESNTSIDGLNPQFSICAANFIKAFSVVNGPVRLNSAYRTQAQQQCVCNVAAGLCGGVGTVKADGSVEGGSNHVRGVALDITPLNGDFVKLHAFASANPALGVHFPFGMADRQHLEPVSMTGPCATPGQQSLSVLDELGAPPSGSVYQQGTGIPPHPYQSIFSLTSSLAPLITQFFYEGGSTGNTQSAVYPYTTVASSSAFAILGETVVGAGAQVPAAPLGRGEAATLLERVRTEGVVSEGGGAVGSVATTIREVLPAVSALLTTVQELPAETPQEAMVSIYLQIVSLLHALILVLQGT